MAKYMVTLEGDKKEIKARICLIVSFLNNLGSQALCQDWTWLREMGAGVN